MNWSAAVIALNIVALLSLLAGDSDGAAYAQEKIQCPGATLISLNWKDNIGSDPTFRVNTGTQVLQPRLVDIRWAGGQLITCDYALFNGSVAGTYTYTVKRRIQSCEHKRSPSPTNTPYLECRFLQ